MIVVAATSPRQTPTTRSNSILNSNNNVINDNKKNEVSTPWYSQLQSAIETVVVAGRSPNSNRSHNNNAVVKHYTHAVMHSGAQAARLRRATAPTTAKTATRPPTAATTSAIASLSARTPATYQQQQQESQIMLTTIAAAPIPQAQQTKQKRAPVSPPSCKSGQTRQSDITEPQSNLKSSLSKRIIVIPKQHQQTSNAMTMTPQRRQQSFRNRRLWNTPLSTHIASASPGSPSSASSPTSTVSPLYNSKSTMPFRNLRQQEPQSPTAGSTDSGMDEEIGHNTRVNSATTTPMRSLPVGNAGVCTNSTTVPFGTTTTLSYHHQYRSSTVSQEFTLSVQRPLYSVQEESGEGNINHPITYVKKTPQIVSGNEIKAPTKIVSLDECSNVNGINNVEMSFGSNPINVPDNVTRALPTNPIPTVNEKNHIEAPLSTFRSTVQTSTTVVKNKQHDVIVLLEGNCNDGTKMQDEHENPALPKQKDDSIHETPTKDVDKLVGTTNETKQTKPRKQLPKISVISKPRRMFFPDDMEDLDIEEYKDDACNSKGEFSKIENQIEQDRTYQSNNVKCSERDTPKLENVNEMPIRSDRSKIPTTPLTSPKTSKIQIDKEKPQERTSSVNFLSRNSILTSTDSSSTSASDSTCTTSSLISGTPSASFSMSLISNVVPDVLMSEKLELAVADSSTSSHVFATPTGRVSSAISRPNSQSREKSMYRLFDPQSERRPGWKCHNVLDSAREKHRDAPQTHRGDVSGGPSQYKQFNDNRYKADVLYTNSHNQVVHNHRPDAPETALVYVKSSSSSIYSTISDAPCTIKADSAVVQDQSRLTDSSGISPSICRTTGNAIAGTLKGRLGISPREKCRGSQKGRNQDFAEKCQATTDNPNGNQMMKGVSVPSLQQVTTESTRPIMQQHEDSGLRGSHCGDSKCSEEKLEIPRENISSRREHVTSHTVRDPYGDEGQFTGVLSRGKPDSYGTMLYADGRVYSGSWKRGRWDGHGQVMFLNGDTYTGEYVRDKRHGVGRYEWSNGRVYDGGFERDQREGHGIYSWPDGSVYSGDFHNGLRHGLGTFTFSDGSVYNGTWRDGKQNGHGECVWADGRCFRGDWVTGHARYGVEVRADGTIRHNGEWCNDRPVRKKKKKLVTKECNQSSEPDQLTKDGAKVADDTRNPEDLTEPLTKEEVNNKESFASDHQNHSEYIRTGPSTPTSQAKLDNVTVEKEASKMHDKPRSNIFLQLPVETTTKNITTTQIKAETTEPIAAIQETPFNKTTSKKTRVASQLKKHQLSVSKRRPTTRPKSPLRSLRLSSAATSKGVSIHFLPTIAVKHQQQQLLLSSKDYEDDNHKPSSISPFGNGDGTAKEEICLADLLNDDSSKDES